MAKRKKGKRRSGAKKKTTAKRRTAKKRSAAKKRSTPRRRASRRSAPRKGKGKMPAALKAYWAAKRAGGGGGASHARSSAPRSRISTKRRRNPSLPEPVMNAAKAVGGGFLAAAATLAGSMLLQKLPPMTKIPSVATQVGVGIVSGAALGAAGMPAAGVVVAAGFGAAALQTARTPALSGDTGVSGLLEREKKIRGLVEGQRVDSYQEAQQRQIKGLVDFVRR